MKCVSLLVGVLSLGIVGGVASAEEASTEKRLAEQEEEIEGLQARLKALQEKVEASAPGTTKFLITGYAFANFTDREDDNSAFSAGFNPIFLWKLTDRIFFEGEIELELEGDETEVALEYAHVTYLLNDYVTLGAGKFLSPINPFIERLHPAWINKLPDRPLAFAHDGILPDTHLGAQARGGFQLGPIKLNYALLVSNGGTLNTGEEEPEEVGLLHFNNFEDANDSKAVGGRIGFFPIPELEVGYGAEWSEVEPKGSSLGSVDAFLQSADLNYTRDSDLLRGTIDARLQWAWSDVDTVTFDPDGTSGFGPLRFNNDRSGGYGQLAYRPSKLDNGFVRNLEAVVRFDALDAPRGAPVAVDEERWTIGLNYWLGPSAVIKVAYQVDDKDAPAEAEDGARDQNAVLVQAAIGF